MKKKGNLPKNNQYCKRGQTPPWTKAELKKVLKKLKSNKCRDPNGMINEIFIGVDLQMALFDLFNLCKSKMQITDFMERRKERRQIKYWLLQRNIYCKYLQITVDATNISRQIWDNRLQYVRFPNWGEKRKKREGTYLCSKWGDSRYFKGASERFGDPAFLDSLVATDRWNTCVFWFDMTIFFTIRTQRLLLKLSKAAKSQFCCV